MNSMHKSEKRIFTIGHSTHEIAVFQRMLESFSIKELVDIRRYPGSARYPHFNKENLQKSLNDIGVSYTHIETLGGRRAPKKDSKNTAWKNKAFQGYADYMETDEFKNAVNDLIKIAEKNAAAIMCSEAVWWSCHRALVSDYLKSNGWIVLHIMSTEKTTEHPYTRPAQILQGKLFY